ncbi:MAG: HEAT repeat domain-containing protein [Gemmatimonas sp.]|uniref:HEAT repeat domain-containing protein n=2 Tax=Gemmatimonas sp. TaxID=1962908 RepID=UPI00391EF594
MSSASSAVLPLLSGLALAIARRRSYGNTHPMVVQADEALSEVFVRHIEAHASLTLAVANRDLLVNGEVMSGNTAVVRDLAARLHGMGIGAIRVERGLTLGALSALVALLARRQTEVDDAAPFPDLQGIVIGRIDFEQLGLADEATLRAEGEQLWHTLATRTLEGLSPRSEAAALPAAAVGDVPSGSHDPLAASATSGLTLADALAIAASDPRAAWAAFAALSDLANRIATAPRTLRDTVGAQLDALFAGVDDEALSALLASASDNAVTRFLSALVEILPAPAVIRWLNLSAQTSGRELSPHMLRIITKMTAHRSSRSRDAADHAVRETVLELIQGWEVIEPNPMEHHQLLDTLAHWSANDPHPTSDGQTVQLDPISHEAVRLVQMACEIDVVSHDTVPAVRHLADHGLGPQVLAWAELAASQATRDRLRGLTVTPQAIAKALLGTPFDAAEAKQLLDGLPDESAPLLIEPLERCESRTGRRLIYDRLQRAGPAIVPMLHQRLTQPAPWYLVRNLLGLLRDVCVDLAPAALATEAPPGPLLLFQTHEQPPVRREAVRVLVLYPDVRPAALRRALDDANAEVRLAAIEVMLALGEAIPQREVVSRLLAIADQEPIDLTTREKAVRAAARSRHAEVREWLVEHATRRGLLKSRRLAPVTPLVRTALLQLALHFGEHGEVAPILVLARQAGVLSGSSSASAAAVAR